MEIQEVLSNLKENDGRFPRVALEQAVALREEIAPALLEILEDMERDPQPYMAADRMDHIYAMFLLAQFRETRAYPLLVRIFSAPGEIAHDLTGDIAAVYLGRILASVSDGDIDGIVSLIENEQVDEFVRSSAIGGFLALVECGKRSREEIMAYYGGLFHKLDRTPNSMWNELANCCAHLCPREVMPDLRDAYEEGLIEPFLVGWEQIEEALAEGPPRRGHGKATGGQYAHFGCGKRDGMVGLLP